MNRSRTAGIWRSLLCLMIAGGVSLGVYVLTLAPDLTWSHYGGDGGDFVTAAITGRIPHPPGFPVYMALADGLVRLPWKLSRPPAWRLNLLSAVMASATVGALAWILQSRGSDVNRRLDEIWLALATSLTLAFAPLFWSQALITEVYTTAAFFVMLSLGFWIKRKVSDHPLHWTFAAGLAWGLGISVHLTLIFMFPLWILWREPYTAREKTAARKKQAAVFMGGVLLGLLPYVGLPLRGPWPQPWGDLRSFSGWWDVVRGRLYWGFAFSLPISAWFPRMLAYVSLLTRQFTPVGALLTLQGVAILWKRHPLQMLGLVGAFMLGGLYAIGYNTPDSLVYLVPLLPLAALGLWEGEAWLIERGWPAWGALFLPLALLGLHGRAMDLHNDREAVRWIAQVLEQTPSEAVLLTAQDQHTFALWYAQAALRLRPDVLVVDRDLWAKDRYRRFLMDKAYPAASEDQIEALTRMDAMYPPLHPLCRVEDWEVYCW